MCRCLFVTQQALAGHIASAIASVGFINRGAKKRTDLFFLNQTVMPSILIEVCFVDSMADADLYREKFDAVCEAIANVLGGPAEAAVVPPPDVPAAMPDRVDIQITGNVIVTINGQPVTGTGT
jgi:N-acetylmuramoyl-L-alanine amidase